MNYNTVYHVTLKRNLLNILNERCLKSSFSHIYVCPSYEDMLKFIVFSEKWPIDECVVLKLKLASNLPNKWVESTDHNKKFIPADALIYKASKLPFIDADVIAFNFD